MILKLILLVGVTSLFLVGCAAQQGQMRKHTTPGHVQQYTGCNYASGKCKAKHVKPAKVLKELEPAKALKELEQD